MLRYSTEFISFIVLFYLFLFWFDSLVALNLSQFTQAKQLTEIKMYITEYRNMTEIIQVYSYVLCCFEYQAIE